jgi:hypothetical protein
MDCLNTSIDKFILHHGINPMYTELIITYLKDSNYTIYNRTTSLYVDKKITVQLIKNITDIKPNTIIGIYVKPNEYLNVFGYHYFYVDTDHIISSWYSTRNISEQEYSMLENKERSLSETSIENANIEPTHFDLSILNQLWDILHNNVNDIGSDLYKLFGGDDLAIMTLKKSENKLFMYMFNIL